MKKFIESDLTEILVFPFRPTLIPAGESRKFVLEPNYYLSDDEDVPAFVKERECGLTFKVARLTVPFDLAPHFGMKITVGGKNAFMEDSDHRTPCMVFAEGRGEVDMRFDDASPEKPFELDVENHTKEDRVFRATAYAKRVVKRERQNFLGFRADELKPGEKRAVPMSFRGAYFQIRKIIVPSHTARKFIVSITTPDGGNKVTLNGERFTEFDSPDLSFLPKWIRGEEVLLTVVNVSNEKVNFNACAIGVVTLEQRDIDLYDAEAEAREKSQAEARAKEATL